MNLRVSFSLRAFVVYFLALAILTWILVDQAVNRLIIMMEQTTELAINDTVHLASGEIEHALASGKSLQEAAHLYAKSYALAHNHALNANVHGIIKRKINAHFYVTNDKGMVIYDSQHKDVGENYSKWRDVRLTLAGKYGARTSVSSITENDEMIISAPIMHDGQLVGVIAIRHDLESLAETALIETETLKRLAIIGVLLVTVLIFFLSRWLTHMLNRLAEFADAMATGARVPKPFFLDKRLDKLATSILNMRAQIDGKAYVEQYVHSLTHELKTPITGINASTEFLRDNTLTDDERQHFVDNIDASNQRMADLVDRVLGLAKLEHQHALHDVKVVKLHELVQKTLQQQALQLNTKAISLTVDVDERLTVSGDPFLLGQALSNLLDNAIDFCPCGGNINIYTNSNQLHIDNSVAAPIPDYALDKLFDRFYSTPRPNTQKRSTGLGLSFVREIMKLHKGDIQLMNQENACVSAILTFANFGEKH